MKKLLVLLLFLGGGALADDPSRDSLIDAWEAWVSGLPSTVAFEALGERRYRIEDSDLDYAGELELTSALVRPAELYGEKTEFTHFGIVEFRLVDLPPERMGSQAFYYWLADRQTLHYSSKQGAWVDPASYRASFMDNGDYDVSLGPMQFMLNYGVWIGLLALLLFVFVAFYKQTRKARSIMDESTDINAMARKNIERASELQTEMMEFTRESQVLQRENNVLLNRIADALEKRS